MKCVRKDNTVKRVTDTEAKNLVQQGWKYCPKSAWKAAGKPR